MSGAARVAAADGAEPSRSVPGHSTLIRAPGRAMIMGRLSLVTERPAGPGRGHLPTVQNELAVHGDEIDADGVLQRLRVSGDVADRRRVVVGSLGPRRDAGRPTASGECGE